MIMGRIFSAAASIAMCGTSLAAQGVSDLDNVHQSLTYVVDGVSMVVSCVCNLEAAKVFEIGVQTAFENMPQAAFAAMDVAQAYCALDHQSEILFDVGQGDFSFGMRYEGDLQSWQLSGRCI